MTERIKRDPLHLIDDYRKLGTKYNTLRDAANEALYVLKCFNVGVGPRYKRCIEDLRKVLQASETGGGE